MKKIFTIGFTKKTAEEFFSLLEKNNIACVVDVRLNNTSQLAAFSKFPDIKFFLNRICRINYIHDIKLAPTKNILNEGKKHSIDWHEYEIEFEKLMKEREINEYIFENYSSADNLCLLCSEPTPEKCHRRLVAEKFSKVFKDVKIIHL